MNDNKTKALALFDFDGTVSTKDSLIEFTKYAVGTTSFFLGMARLSPMLIQYKLKLIRNDIAKQKMLTYFFGDWDESRFKEIAKQYAEQEIDKMVRPKALERIKWHQQQNHEISLVSASIEDWLRAWCDKQGIKIIATQLEYKQGKVTGRFATPNCYGPEKAVRVKAAYQLEHYGEIYAYGDTSGDKQLLEISTKPHYRFFH